MKFNNEILSTTVLYDAKHVLEQFFLYILVDFLYKNV